MRQTMRTLRPGEVSTKDLMGPVSDEEPPPPADPVERVAVAVTREALKQLTRSTTGRGQWAAIIALAAAFAMHIVGDGTVRANAERTECLVEWLVNRAVAEDQGQPPPQLSPLACHHP